MAFSTSLFTNVLMGSMMVNRSITGHLVEDYQVRTIHSHYNQSSLAWLMLENLIDKMYDFVVYSHSEQLTTWNDPRKSASTSALNQPHTMSPPQSLSPNVSLQVIYIYQEIRLDSQQATKGCSI